MCPEGRAPEGAEFAPLGPRCRVMSAPRLRPRLPLRGQAPPGLASEVPAARRPPGPEDARAGVDGARPPAGGLLHEAHGRGVAAASRSSRRPTGTLPGMVRTGATVADACAEYLRYIEQDRQRKPSTLRDYDSIFRNHVLPHLGDDPARGPHARARRALGGARDRPGPPPGEPDAREDDHRLPRRHGASPQAPPPAGEPGRRRREAAHRHAHRDQRLLARRRSWRSSEPPTPSRTPRSTSPPPSPASARASSSPSAGETSTSPARRSASAASYTNGHLTSPKSGKVRSVPMAPKVAEALARLGQREFFTDEDDLVFAGITGGYLDGSALSKRYRAALERAGAPPAPLPRPPPHLRHARHRRRRHPPRPGVDGPRERPDDDAVPPLRPAPAGRGARRRGVRPRVEQLPCSTTARPTRGGSVAIVLSRPTGVAALSLPREAVA